MYYYIILANFLTSKFSFFNTTNNILLSVYFAINFM